MSDAITKAMNALNDEEKKLLVTWASHGVVWKRWVAFITGAVCGVAAFIVLKGVFHF